MSDKEFTIDKVAWHANKPGGLKSLQDITSRFWVFVDFLQRNGLTHETLAASPEDIHEGFAVRSSQLTSKGLEVVRLGYDRWLRGIDRGKSPADTAALDKALARVEATA